MPATTAPMIEPYDGPTAPEAILREVESIWSAEFADLHPEDPPYSWEELEGLLRTDSTRTRRRRWFARGEGGQPIGRLDIGLPSASSASARS